MREENNVKNIILRYVVGVVFATLILFLVLMVRDYFHTISLVEKYRFLADGFTIPGALFILFGCLVFLVNEGSLSALSYMIKRLGKSLLPFLKKDNMTYSEYCETRKKVSGFSFLFVIGTIYLLIGIVFIILFYSVF